MFLHFMFWCLKGDSESWVMTITDECLCFLLLFFFLLVFVFCVYCMYFRAVKETMVSVWLPGKINKCKDIQTSDRLAVVVVLIILWNVSPCRLWSEWLSSRPGCLHTGEVLHLDWLQQQGLGRWGTGEVEATVQPVYFGLWADKYILFRG